MGTLIAIMDICIVVAVFSGLFWFLRWKYARDIGKTKDHPHGCLVAEFWVPSGPRIREPMPILDNGFEIKAPAGHKCPRYFFNKSSVGRTKYPTNPLLPFDILKVDADIVSWYMDNPEPIPATSEQAKIGGKVVTSELLDLARDTETLATAQAVSDELTKTQQELRRALTERISKTAFYVMTGLAAGASAAALVVGIMVYRILSSWGG